jgi:hypothetical protein
MALDTSLVSFAATSSVPMQVGTVAVTTATIKTSNTGAKPAYVGLALTTNLVINPQSPFLLSGLQNTQLPNLNPLVGSGLVTSKVGNGVTYITVNIDIPVKVSGAVLAKVGTAIGIFPLPALATKFTSVISDDFSNAIPSVNNTNLVSQPYQLTTLQTNIPSVSNPFFGSGVVTSKTGTGISLAYAVGSPTLGIGALTSGLLASVVGTSIPPNITYQVIALKYITSSASSASVGNAIVPSVNNTNLVSQPFLLNSLQSSLLQVAISTFGTGVVTTKPGTASVYQVEAGLVSNVGTGLIPIKVGISELAYVSSSKSIPQSDAIYPFFTTGAITAKVGNAIPSVNNTNLVSQPYQLTTLQTNIPSVANPFFGSGVVASRVGNSLLPISTVIGPIAYALSTGAVSVKVGTCEAASISSVTDVNLQVNPTLFPYGTTGAINAKIGNIRVSTVLNYPTPSSQPTTFQTTIPSVVNPVFGNSLVVGKVGNTEVLVTEDIAITQSQNQSGVVTVIVGNAQVPGGFTFQPTLSLLQQNTQSGSTTPTGFSGVGWKTGNSNTILQYWS